MCAPDPTETKGIKVVVFDSEIKKHAERWPGKVGMPPDGAMGVAGDIVGGLVTDRIK